jgi:hypothetical protein
MSSLAPRVVAEGLHPLGSLHRLAVRLTGTNGCSARVTFTPPSKSSCLPVNGGDYEPANSGTYKAILELQRHTRQGGHFYRL